MIEQWLSIAAAIVVFIAAVLRLNVLKAARHSVNAWRVSEVLGLAALMSGCTGAVGEWFLVNADFHAETIVMVGAAMFALGVSRGQLCQLVARLQGWDGGDRRSRPRVDDEEQLAHVGGAPLAAEEFLDMRFRRRS